MEVVRLESADAVAMVHPAHGARVGSLTVRGTDLLVATGPTPLDWGMYPMVPFAGRMRDAQVHLAGVSYELAANDPAGTGHALHGTVFDAAWRVVEQTASLVRCQVSLGDGWPFRGDVVHTVELTDNGVHCTLELTARDDMPAMLGWHPWFVKPQHASLPFTAMLDRGSDYLPTGRVVPAVLDNADDCFVDPDGALVLTIGDASVTLSSDCSHWVVYNQPSHATCVEPQSGAPNAVNDSPTIVRAGETLTRWFHIAWT